MATNLSNLTPIPTKGTGVDFFSLSFPLFHPMNATLKIVAVLIGIIALSLVELVLMFWLGGRDVKNFCHEIKPGIPTSQLAALAKKHDVRLNMPGSREGSGAYLAIAHTPRSFGRHTCTVRHDNAVVIGSQYGYAD